MSKYPPPTKCEVLLTRRCPLNCWYCRMKRNNWPELSPEEWSMVPEKLVELGVKFAPIYGAEPLSAYKSLLNFIKSCTEVNLPNSVITNALLLTEDRMKELREAGLTSVTFSYDIVPKDENTKRKQELTEKVIDKALQYFEDVEIVVTLYSENYKCLPEIVEKFTKKGVWVHFDFYHPDRGQEGSKCCGSDSAFKKEDLLHLRLVLEQIADNEYLHPRPVMKFILDNLELLTKYHWKCVGGGWITLDSDGSVFGCDDFQPQSVRGKFHILKYGKEWSWGEFVDVWRKYLVDCPGCAWITHIMSDIWWLESPREWVSQITHGRC